MIRARRGFTLLELMVVLVLFAITAAAAVPAFLGSELRGPEREAAAALAAALTRTRDAARVSGAPATMMLSPADGRYWITARDSAASGTLPIGGVRLEAGCRSERSEEPARADDEVHALRCAQSDRAAPDRLSCRFTPTGTATPCVVTVRGARDLTVRVDGWSGEVRVD